MPCSLRDLNALEEKLIGEAGKHFALRNIKHSIATSREVPFDKVIDDEERERFVAGGDLTDAPWRPLELLTRVQERRYTKFLAIPGGAEALAAAREFIRRAIPKPSATEIGFWSITLFPRTKFIRVNAGQQEVFTCAAGERGCEVRVLTDERVSVLRSIKARYRVQSYITTMPASALREWLQGKNLRSCRRLVVRLMRHTIALNSASHCPQAVRVDENAR